jgi:hypothetical protein
MNGLLLLSSSSASSIDSGMLTFEDEVKSLHL